MSEGLWSRYMRGDVVPVGALAYKPDSVVKRLDAIYPGTEMIFQHPLWTILDFSRDFTLRELRQLFVDLSSLVWPTFVKLNGERTGPASGSNFWRRKYGAEWGQVLVTFEGIDGIATYLVEARANLLEQNRLRFVLSMCAAGKSFLLLSEPPRKGYIPSSPIYWPAVRSALLTAERMCLGHAIDTAFFDGDVQLPLGGEEGKAREKKPQELLEDWKRDWRKRYGATTQRLPLSKRHQLTAWIRQVDSENSAQHLEH